MRLLLAPRSVAVVGAGRERDRCRPRRAAQPAGPRLQRARVPGQPAHRPRGRRAGRRRPSATSTGPVDLAVVVVPAAEVPGVIEDCGAQGGQGGHRHLGRVRRVGPRGRGAVGGRAAGRPPVRDPPARPQLPGRHQHRPRGPAARHVRHAQPAAAARWRCCPSRGRSAGPCSTASARPGWGRRRSPPSATAPTCRPTTCCSTGPTTTAPAWCCCTSSRSATPASSAASPGEMSRRQADRRGARAAGRPGPTRATASCRTTRLHALLEQTGVIRVDTLSQQLDVARVLACQPLPAGPRVALVGNGGGSLALAADACVDAGLTLAELGEGVRAAVDDAGDAAAARVRASTIDLGFEAVGDDLARTLTAAAGRRRGRQRAGGVRAGAAPVDRRPGRRHRRRPGRGARQDAAGLRLRPAPVTIAVDGGAEVPVFDFPDDAAYALGRVTRYAQWRAAPEGELTSPDGTDPRPPAPGCSRPWAAGAGDGGNRPRCSRPAWGPTCCGRPACRWWHPRWRPTPTPRRGPRPRSAIPWR